MGIAFNAGYYNLWFSLCGLILCLVVVVVYYFERSLSTRQGRVFELLTGMIMFMELLTLFHCIWIGNEWVHEVFSVDSQEIVTTIEKLCVLTIPLVTMLYTMEIYHISMDKLRIKLLFIIPEGITVLTILSVYFTPFFLTFNEEADMVYQYPAAILVYSNAIVSIFYTIYLNMTYGYILSREKMVAIWCFTIFAIAGAAARIVLDAMTMYEFFLSVSVLLYVYTLENPGEYIDSDADCLNRQGFDYMVKTRLAQNKPFSVGSIYVEELSMLENIDQEQGQDRLVRLIIKEIRNAVGEDSDVFRLRGSILAVLLPWNDEGRSLRTMERILDRFRLPWDTGNSNIRLIAHICLILCPDEADNLERIIDMSEQAVKELRRQNKAILRASDIDMETVYKKRRITDAVKRAVEEHLFEVYYQPIYEPRTGRFTSAEALLRLRDPDIGFISPGEFIPIAEQNGMIVQIDRYVLEEACKLMSETNVRALGLEYIEVNLSVVDCIQSDLADRVMDILRRYRVEPSEINLEVTETAEEGMSYSIQENLRKLSREGIIFSLDDFGTGYSNLKRLTQMPLTLIKLDKSVIQPAFENDYSYKILLGMIRLVRALGREMVAEGVETEEQAQKLIRLSCDHIQGFFYARPLNRENFLRFLREKN